MELLFYADELRARAESFDEVPTVKPQKDMVDLARQLMEKKAGPSDPKEFQGH